MSLGSNLEIGSIWAEFKAYTKFRVYGWSKILPDDCRRPPNKSASNLEISIKFLSFLARKTTLPRAKSPWYTRARENRVTISILLRSKLSSIFFLSASIAGAERKSTAIEPLFISIFTLGLMLWASRVKLVSIQSVPSVIYNCSTETLPGERSKTKFTFSYNFLFNVRWSKVISKLLIELIFLIGINLFK